ncbi:AfsR/SARP family transcriptional regulator [Nonomuraea sp. SYSU D8015]|uniref:AfsR/SARP family transcriptional regulator n=1 Tax=Nonomuraea sp. SYSU D8015 TaxID=2593644 RepID=UPI00166145EF|nr:BTAD domain-containing putative transcriptional regulator [Nonomuraea sp. SYSU D8015]
MNDIPRPDFSILGPVLAHGPGGPVQLSGKPRAVLSTLLLHVNTPISRDRLIAALWDRPPSSAVANLQTYISQLRRSLSGIASLHTQGSSYLLPLDRDRLDLLVFDDAVQRGRREARRGDLEAADREFGRALSLWRGRPAEDVRLSSAMTPRITELEEQLAQARADWIDVRLDLGRDDRLTGELRAIVEAHPLWERARTQLMLALYRAGRRAEALDVYREARTVLVAELGIEPGPELTRLHAAILSDDPSLNRPAVVEAAGWTAICQLPPDIGDFVGREQELESLSAAMLGGGAGAPLIATVHGTPGVGKSTLALHLAHRLRPHFPDGQLFLRLAGASPSPRDPSDLLAELLRALRVDGAAIPASCDERAALYRSRLADRAVLLLLDDAADEAQVRPLLPGTPRSAVLITSRSRLMLEGAAAVSLDPPSRTEARDLLARMAGESRLASDPEAAHAILQACGRLPLAIRIAGARLAARPSWPLRDLAARLEDTRKRLDELALGQQSVRANFAVSYAALPPTAQRAFRLLGLAGFESAAEWAVAALLGEPAGNADAAIEALVLAGLLTPGETDAAGQPRYLMHDLLRVYARDRAEAEENERQRRQALYGLVAECLDRTRAAVRDLPRPAAPGPTGSAPQRAVGYEWLAAERHNLVATVALAVELKCTESAAELAYHLTSYLAAHHFYDDVVRIQRAVMTLGDTDEVMRARLILADMDIERGRYHDALSEFESLLRHFADAGDRHGATYAMTGRGVCRHVLSDHQAALADLTGAVSVFRELGDDGGALHALLDLSAVYLEVGRYDDAIDVCHSGLELTAGGRNSLDRSRLLRGLGIAHYEKGQVDAAIRYYEESLRLTGDLDYDDGGEPKTLRRLGEAYGAVGRFDEATHVLGQSLKEFVRSGNALGEALTTYAFGEICHRQGRIREALRHFTRSGDLIGKLGASLWRARVLREIGRAHADLGDRDAAMAAWAEALDLFTGLGSAEAAQVSELIDQSR